MSLWEDATRQQILDPAEDKGITFISMEISNVEQILVNDGTQRRDLQVQSLEIYFDLAMIYWSDDPLPPTLEEIFGDAFDTEADRNNFLIKLNRADDPAFDALRVISAISVVNETVSPTVAPTSAPPQPMTNAPAASTSGPAAGTTLVAFLSLVAMASLC